MPNSYVNNTWSSFSNNLVSGSLSGVTMLATAGITGLGLLGGLVVGGIMAGIGLWQDQVNLKNQRSQVRVQREAINEQRNQLITSAQREISSFRSSFDSTYGEGMYDTYDELFQRVFNLPAGSQTVSDLINSLSLDNVAGTITTRAEGAVSDEALTSVLSASNVNSTYLEYMQSQIRDAETAIGLQFQSQTMRERSILNNYYDSIDQYNLAIAEQLSNAFLQQRQTNQSLASSMGKASTAQATSGIRQTGSGRNLTTIQQFQQDMSNLAYNSMLDYTIRQYQGQMETSNRGIIEQISSIRLENAQLTEQFTNDFFNSMNQHYGQLGEYYYGITDAEGSIDELNAEEDRLDAAIWLD